MSAAPKSKSKPASNKNWRDKYCEPMFKKSKQRIGSACSENGILGMSNQEIARATKQLVKARLMWTHDQWQTVLVILCNSRNAGTYVHPVAVLPMDDAAQAARVEAVARMILGETIWDAHKKYKHLDAVFCVEAKVKARAMLASLGLAGKGETL